MDIDPIDIPGVDEGSGEPATLVDLPPERRAAPMRSVAGLEQLVPHRITMGSMSGLLRARASSVPRPNRTLPRATLSPELRTLVAAPP
jgi:hypothetical protein